MYIDDKIDFSEDKKKEIKGKIKQGLIDVMFFDCLLGNSDRSDENFGLLVGNDICTLYPIFDNEYILGLYQYKSALTLFDTRREKIQEIVQELINGKETKADDKINNEEDIEL